MELYVVSAIWLGSDTSGTFSVYFAQTPAIIWTWETSFEDAHTLVQNWHCSCKLFAKMILENQFTVPLLCKLTYISVGFIQTSKEITCTHFIPFMESHVFFKLIHNVLGRLVNFNLILRFLLRAPVFLDNLSVSCGYVIA